MANTRYIALRPWSVVADCSPCLQVGGCNGSTSTALCSSLREATLCNKGTHSSDERCLQGCCTTTPPPAATATTVAATRNDCKAEGLTLRSKRVNAPLSFQAPLLSFLEELPRTTGERCVISNLLPSLSKEDKARRARKRVYSLFFAGKNLMLVCRVGPGASFC